MPTVDDKRFELKQKRSDALMAKLNILMKRDGSIIPAVQSLKEEDDFNMAYLFGKSKSHNIDWDHLGVEGLIQSYYHAIEIMNGKARNYNIVSSGDHDTGLNEAANLLITGQGYNSAYYIGWSSIQRDIDAASGTRKANLQQAQMKGLSGDLYVPMVEGWPALASSLGVPNVSEIYTDNRLDPVTDNPDHLLKVFGDFKTFIGSESPLGAKSFTVSWGNSPPAWSTLVNSTLLGRRFRDVAPYTYTAPSSNTTTSGGGTDSEGNSIPSTSTTTYTDGFVTFGNGAWDTTNSSNPPGYTTTPDVWDNGFITYLDTIITRLTSIITYISRTKITDFTYFVNPKIIPGIDPNYNPSDASSTLGSTWTMQNNWISTLTTVRDRFTQSKNLLTPLIQGSSTTAASRTTVNNELQAMKTFIDSAYQSIVNIAAALDNPSIFGTISSPLSLYGHRYMWIRSMLDSQDGTKTQFHSLQSAIDKQTKKVLKAEEELYMYGVYDQEFIPDPMIVGIEPNPVVNSTTMELEYRGWIVSWMGQKHCTGYDIYKSEDYNKNTKAGTWTKLEISHTEHTMTDIDARNGNVQVYIIDTTGAAIPVDVDVSTLEYPYYKVKAFDKGSYGDYNRKVAGSNFSDPANPSAFPTGGAGANQGPRVTPKSVVVEQVPSGANIPANSLLWVTTLKGNQAKDFELRVYESEAPFDSIGSNIVVFVNGRFQNNGVAGVGDYILKTKYQIQFNDSLSPSDEVNIVAFLRSFAPNKSVMGAVTYKVDLPKTPIDGEVWLVESETTYYQYVATSFDWVMIEDPNRKSAWRDPVNSFAQLPQFLNSEGDMRLVLSDSMIYRWNASSLLWTQVSGSSSGGGSGGSGGSWQKPVETYSDLSLIDTSNIANGTIIFVIADETLYRWNATKGKWIALIGPSSNQSFWKSPVNSKYDLPNIANMDGDVRIVLGENKPYVWDSSSVEWVAMVSDAKVKHEELVEVDWSVVDNHDGRYYTRTDMDTKYSDLESKLEHLYSLKPIDATPLSGDFNITGIKLYGGFISNSTYRKVTLQANQFYGQIIKSSSFILSNNDGTQLADGDKGIIELVVNGVAIDSFDLAANFIEADRAAGQKWCPLFGSKNRIEILSVKPFNQYPSYQRADFQIYIRTGDLISGENAISLRHTFDTTIRNTNEFIVYYDDNTISMGFKDIKLTEAGLVSQKYLSGIRYYSTGDSFQLLFTSENMFNNTYVEDDQINVNLDNFGISSVSTNYKDSRVLGSIVPYVNTDFNWLGTLSITRAEAYSSAPSVSIRGKSVFTSTTVNQPFPFLINTVTTKSDDLNEYFVDEHYRLPVSNYDVVSSIINVWNSQSQLTSSDLCVYGKALVYPTVNATKLFPAQATNYSGLSGSRSYLRAFKYRTPKTNGKLTVEGFVADGSIKIEIKFPSLSGWLDLTKQYNVSTFTGVDGDGCLIKRTGEIFEWTADRFNTVNSGNLVIVRITTLNKSINIKRLAAS
jgi:hypothetical protein